MNQNELRAMSVAEKLQIIETLWSTLVDLDVAIESPAWHEDILAERKQKIESGQAHFISLETLRSYYKK